MKYKCYYHKLYSNKYLGEKIYTETFDTEIEAEIYCNKNIDVDMNYDAEE